MAILIPCRLPCHSDEDQSQSQSEYTLQSESSTSSSLSSQPSLPSVPSLTPPPDHQHGHQSTPSTHHRCVATFRAHSSYVSSLVVAGKILYTGSSDGEIRAWSRDPSQLNSTSVYNLVATTDSAVKSLVVSGNMLFSAHQDNKIRVWNKVEHHVGTTNQPQKLKCVATLPTLNDRISRLFSAKNYVEVRRHKKSTWVHHVDAVSALAVSRDGALLYSASWDRTFKVWRTSDFKCLESVSKAHDDAINAIAISGDGYAYTGSADKKIKVWKKKSDGDRKHTLESTLEKHRSAVNALALSSNGSVLYSGACDRSVLVWERDERRSMAVVGALRGHTRAILCLAAVDDLLVSGSADCSVRIWRRGIDRGFCCLSILDGHRRPVKCLTVNTDSNSNASGISYLVCGGSLDGQVKVWQIWVPNFI